jgi:hypothetical protein
VCHERNVPQIRSPSTAAQVLPEGTDLLGHLVGIGSFEEAGRKGIDVIDELVVADVADLDWHRRTIAPGHLAVQAERHERGSRRVRR